MRKTALALTLMLAGCDLDEILSPAIHNAKEGVREDMRDPSSTIFRNVKVCPRDKNIVTGEYNSKNGFGAYAGFERFYAEGRIASS